MSRLVVAALLLAASLPVSRAASPAPPAVEPPDISAEVAAAPAVVLEDVTHWTIGPYSSELDVTRRIRINTEDGVRYATQSLTLDGRVDSKYDTKLVALSGRTLAPGGGVFELTPGMQSRTVLPDRDGERTTLVTITFPNVTPGSIIEWNYRTERGYRPGRILEARRSERTVLENRLPWPWWEIQGPLPVLSSRFVVHSHHAKILESWIVQGHSRVPTAPWCRRLPTRPEPDHDVHEFVCRNVPAFEAEPLAPPEKDVRLRMMLTWVSPDVFARDAWGSMDEPFWDRLVAFYEKRKRVRAVAREEIGNSGPPTERIERLVRTLRRRVTIDLSRGFGRELTARTADEVLESGRGSDFEVVALTRVLAEELGFNAYLALIADGSDQGFAANVPDYDQRSRYMVEVDDGRTQWILDPACTHCDGGLPDARFCGEGRAGIRYPKSDYVGGGAAYLTAIDPISAARNTVVRVEQVVLDAHGDGQVTARLAWDGQPEQEQRDALAAHEAAARGALLLAAEPGEPASPSATVSNPDDMDTPLTADLAYRAPGLAVARDERTLVLHGRDAISRAFPLPSGEARRYPVWFGKPSTHRTATTYVLPDGFVATILPADFQLAVPGAKGLVTWKPGASPHEIVATAELVIDKSRVPASAWPALRDLFTRFRGALDVEIPLVRGGGGS